MVQGDTSSALGGALAAFDAGVPVAHVEAGLRSHDPRQPWPEEEYRRRIDARSELLFAPTPLAAANLREERVPGEIHITGNSGIDALVRTLSALPDAPPRSRGRFRILATCHRRENWGSGVKAVAWALAELATDPQVEIEIVLHPNEALAGNFAKMLKDRERVTLSPPCSHRELVQKMRDCDLILSDSGGMQEEAPAIGVPLLVLRDKTERPEAVATGNMRLVGCRTDPIVAAVRGLIDNPASHAAMSRRNFPYGDGKAGPRIAAIIERWVMERRVPQRRVV